jgi:acyl-CoA thioesterase
MGDLSVDTAVEPIEDGHYRASLSRDWEIWGPNGGYLAAIALRAAGAHSALACPASLACHYLSTAEFAPVDLAVETLHSGTRTESLRVSMSQSGNPILEAIVRTVAALDGPEREWTEIPSLPVPAALPTVEEQAAGEGTPTLAFWKNVEIRPLRPTTNTEDHPGDPLLYAWQRFRPQATFDDPWIDACRAAILIDTSQFPAVCGGFRPSELTFIAPSIDLYVAFHRCTVASEWLLGESRGLVAGNGLIGGHALLWSADGQLIASGTQQMLCHSFGG